MSTVMPLMHRDAATRLHEAIERSRHVEPERVPTLTDVDWAIQAAAESWLDEQEQGGPMPDFDFDTPRFGEIVDSVLERLGIDYDEVFEVA